MGGEAERVLAGLTRPYSPLLALIRPYQVLALVPPLRAADGGGVALSMASGQGTAASCHGGEAGWDSGCK